MEELHYLGALPALLLGIYGLVCWYLERKQLEKARARKKALKALGARMADEHTENLTKCNTGPERVSVYFPLPYRPAPRSTKQRRCRNKPRKVILGESTDKHTDKQLERFFKLLKSTRHRGYHWRDEEDPNKVTRSDAGMEYTYEDTPGGLVFVQAKHVSFGLIYKDKRLEAIPGRPCPIGRQASATCRYVYADARM